MAIHRAESFHNDIDSESVEYSFMTKGTSWTRIDTDQDAWYYGNWTNPERFYVVTYAEGDLVVLRCDTAEEFCSELNRMAAWHAVQGSYMRIDPREEHESLWLELGLGHLMASQMAVV